jgi:hypothetical protein
MPSPVYGGGESEDDFPRFRRRLPSYMTDPGTGTESATIDTEVQFLVYNIKASWDELQEYIDEDSSTDMAKTIDIVVCVMVASVCEGVYLEETIYSSLVSELEWLFYNVPRERRYDDLHANIMKLDTSLARYFNETD